MILNIFRLLSVLLLLLILDSCSNKELIYRTYQRDSLATVHDRLMTKNIINESSISNNTILINTLQDSIANFKKNIAVLENDIINLNSKININESIKKTNEREILNQNTLTINLQNKILTLESEIKNLNNLITEYKSKEMETSQELLHLQNLNLTIDNNDFLNKYINKEIAINDLKLSMKLKQLYLISNNDNYDYNGNNVRSFPNVFYDYQISTYFSPKKGVVLDGPLEDLLPELEFVKDKLLTFKYKNGNEYTFLVKITENLNEIGQKETNFSLIAEGNNSNYSEDIKNINLKIINIQSEAYLLVKNSDLNLFGLNTGNLNYDFFRNKHKFEKYSYDFNCAYFYIKKDKSVELNTPVETENAYYLFKLFELK